jgi:hypothetical protein
VLRIALPRSGTLSLPFAYSPHILVSYFLQTLVFQSAIGCATALPSAQVIMAALDTPPLSGCYRVEVSGWDEDEMFFVEKSQLAGNDLTGRHISLQHKPA